MNSKFLFVFALLFVLVAVASGSFSDHEERRLFMDFMKQYSKTYQHDEYRIRFQNFKDNLKRIRDLNSQPGQTAVYAINKFADLSADEFRQTYLMPKFDAKNVCKFPYHFSATPEEVAAIPNTFDWRTKGAVSNVKNQGSCGSCWAFSTIGNIEGQWKLGGHPLVSLSEQWLVDCSHGCLRSEPSLCNGGCGGGLPWLAFEDIVKNKFITTEAAYPYAGYDGTCKSPSTVGAKISNWTASAADQTSVDTLLVNRGPLSICLNANLLMSYTSGVITGSPSQCSSEGTDHAVLLVGYDNTGSVPVWIVKNSWGTDWGEKGFFRIEADNDLCGIWDCVTSAIL